MRKSQIDHFAAAGLIAGHYDVVVAGGVESMSRVPMGSTLQVAGSPFTADGWTGRYGEVMPHQGLGAEMMAERWKLSREQLDEYSLASHEKAAAAQDAGLFDGQIVPVAGRRPAAIRRWSTRACDVAVPWRRWRGLRPAFTDHGVVTAGNSSQISDGSAALLMTTSRRPRELGLSRLARVHTAVLAAADPVIMLTAPSRRPGRHCSAAAPAGRDRCVRGQRGLRQRRSPGSPTSAPATGRCRSR